MALETSCDDTCAAVIEGAQIRSNVVSSQAAFHERYGGVVPEVASRHHLDLVNAVVTAALEEAEADLPDADAVAVTQGAGADRRAPGGAEHGEGAGGRASQAADPGRSPTRARRGNFLEPKPLDPPFLCLIASGGHTLLAGVRERSGFETSRGDGRRRGWRGLRQGGPAAGLGFPGGPAIQSAAEGGDPEAFEFPVAMSERGLDFSFSGLKTALVYRVRDLGPEETERRRADLAASYQRAIVHQLAAKLERAARSGEWPAIALGGGVAANAALREWTEALCDELGLKLKLVPISLCTDNAAMIGAAARFTEPISYPDYLDFDAFATGEAVRAA